MFSIVAFIVIVFGIMGIKHVGDVNREAQLTNFAISFQNKLTAQRIQVNTIEKETFALPNDVELICFVDNAKQFSPLINQKLGERRKSFQSHNMFFSPEKKYSPRKMSYMDLADSENPLCLEVKNGKLGLNFEGDGNKTRVSAQEEGLKSRDCVQVLYNGEAENKLDVVFLGYGYKNEENFADDVNHYVNDVFFEIEPFKSNREKINMYRVDEFDLKCTIGDWVSCDSYSTNLIASNCPHEHVIILVDRNEVVDALTPVRSSAVGNFVKINTADEAYVVMHELGHSIGGLADEYVDIYYIERNFQADKYANCDDSSCKKWANVDGTDCWRGCSTNAYYRSTDTSIMKDLDIHEYGPVNEKELNDILEEYQ